MGVWEYGSMGTLSGQRFIVISELMSDDYFVIQHIGTSAHRHINTLAHWHIFFTGGQQMVFLIHHLPSNHFFNNRPKL